jgi:hypothetical protein
MSRHHESQLDTLRPIGCSYAADRTANRGCFDVSFLEFQILADTMSKKSLHVTCAASLKHRIVRFMRD